MSAVYCTGAGGRAAVLGALRAGQVNQYNLGTFGRERDLALLPLRRLGASTSTSIAATAHPRQVCLLGDADLEDRVRARRGGVHFGRLHGAVAEGGWWWDGG